jgi:beta-galactosidase
MQKMAAVLVAAMALAVGGMRPCCAAQGVGRHTFAVSGGEFQLDGKPFRIISGEVHYARIPRAQWRQTFRMAKAMGLNTITTYVFWNVHEPMPGKFDFSGNADVAEFVREAGEEGLFVILRPGPYSCAEWDLGGFPAWLLKDHTMPLRTTDERFMQPAREWMARLGAELAPLTVGNGGNILLVQVENEYGSYGKDKEYIRQVRQALVDAGFSSAVLYQCDGPQQIPHDALGDMPMGGNFGPSDGVAAKMALYRKNSPAGPYIVSEYWDGWFDHWGAPWLELNAQQQADEVEYILTHDSSISLYMFRGGTSFGFMNGANSGEDFEYEPDVTSYDYDAVLNEAGQPTAKYFLFRKAIAKATGVQPPPVTEAPKLEAVGEAKLDRSKSLWESLPKAVESEHPLSMEDLGQSFGYILYRTTLQQDVSGTLDLGVMHQYALVFVDGVLQGSVDRRMSQHSVELAGAKARSQLDVLVEGTGRINYGHKILGERVGLLTDVSAAGKPLTGWKIYTLPMSDVGKVKFGSDGCSGPCFYRGKLELDKPVDTYLDTRGLKKGELWVNGHNVGRFWSVGPQGSLYVPASWWKAGTNEVVVFDLEAAPGRSVRGIDHLVKDLGGSAK